MKRTVLTVAICLFATTLMATSIRRYSLDEVRDHAEAIFTGSVVSSTVVPVLNGQLSATQYIIEVDEVLQGAVGHTTTVAFVRPGHDGAPALEEGKKYLFFKTGHPNDTTVGWGQGLYRFENIRSESGTRTILISGDGESLVLSGGKLARGPRVRVIDGHIRAQSIERSAANRRDKDGTPFSLSGRAAPQRLAPAQTVTAGAPPAYATVQDVKRFVASAPARNR